MKYVKKLKNMNQMIKEIKNFEDGKAITKEKINFIHKD